MKIILNILFCLVTFSSLIILLYFDVNIILSIIISFIILIVFILLIEYIILIRQRKVLDSDCDPERFMKMLDNQEKRQKKEHKIAISRLAINRAAAQILLGDFQKSKQYLEGIDISYLSEKDGSFLAYTINLILSHYELGEIEQAEMLYETNLVKLCPLGKRIQKTVEILIGERYYYLKKYDLSYEQLSKLNKYDVSKRQYLGILFRLAQMDVMKGETEKAIKKFIKIVKHGNKLWIAKVSQGILENMNYHENNFQDKTTTF